MDVIAPDAFSAFRFIGLFMASNVGSRGKNGCTTSPLIIALTLLPWPP